jgi:hypothetical protein
MENVQLLKPSAAQYATFVEKGLSLDLDFLNAYDWSTVLVEQNGKYGLINCIGEQLVSPNFENFQINRPNYLERQRFFQCKVEKEPIVKAEGLELFLDYLSNMNF